MPSLKKLFTNLQLGTIAFPSRSIPDAGADLLTRWAGYGSGREQEKALLHAKRELFQQFAGNPAYATDPFWTTEYIEPDNHFVEPTIQRLPDYEEAVLGPLLRDPTAQFLQVEAMLAPSARQLALDRVPTHRITVSDTERRWGRAFEVSRELFRDADRFPASTHRQGVLLDASKASDSAALGQNRYTVIYDDNMVFTSPQRYWYQVVMEAVCNMMRKDYEGGETLLLIHEFHLGAPGGYYEWTEGRKWKAACKKYQPYVRIETVPVQTESGFETFHKVWLKLHSPEAIARDKAAEASGTKTLKNAGVDVKDYAF